MKLLKLSILVLIALANYKILAKKFLKANDNNYLRLEKDVNPNTTIFAFDLHDVLFSKNYKTIVKSVFKSLKNGIFWYIINPCFLYKAISISLKDKIWEDIFYSICEIYPDFLKFKEDFLDISNSCCEPIEEAIKIAEKLKEKGYKLFLLSNIGYESYLHFKKTFSNQLSLFDGVYLPSKNNNYDHKPNKSYFNGFLNYLNSIGLNNYQIIFIDDLPKNLDNALELGISGILCKNTDCITNSLKELSIMQ